MGTQYFRFHGLAYWAKVHTPDEKYQRYCVDAYLDDPSLILLSKSGIQLEVREGKIQVDGEETTREYVKFARPISKVIKGKLAEFGPVAVVDAQGTKIEALVGNGSDCIFEIAVYDTIKGKGHRLEKLTVKHLVEFSGGPIDAHNISTANSGPGDSSAKPRLAQTAPINRDTNDEIPF